ncbi:hypothetical protein [Kibdelosporangium philippinense]|uniref:hypothetical protein n=1 Tax=Kibdelosporangium philippinense TaxID=211113 RepID=UPI003618C500
MASMTWYEPPIGAVRVGRNPAERNSVSNSPVVRADSDLGAWLGVVKTVRPARRSQTCYRCCHGRDHELSHGLNRRQITATAAHASG